MTRRRATAYSRVAMMHRRTVLRALLAAAAIVFTAARVAEAQAGKAPRIGMFLSGATQTRVGARHEGLRKASSTCVLAARHRAAGDDPAPDFVS